MSRFKVLLTVTTYPLPSKSYDELVCTAGVLEDGSWIRIYPMPLSFLRGLKIDGKLQSTKYTWIELNLKKRQDDFRPESYSPEDYSFKDLQIGIKLDTKNYWEKRKLYCLKNIQYNMETLIEASKAPTYISCNFQTHRNYKFYHTRNRKRMEARMESEIFTISN